LRGATSGRFYDPLEGGMSETFPKYNPSSQAAF